MVNIQLSSITFLFLAATQATPLAPRNGSSGPNQKAIQWGPCEGLNGTTPLLCGTLSVPLDYSDPESNAGLNIEILKIPAVNGPSKGSIFFNWGGPGAAGKDEFQILGKKILTLTGGSHDLLNVVPRGTGDTLSFTCYSSAAERAAALTLAPNAGNASDVAVGQIWANAQIVADKCYQAQNKTGSFVGTAFTARDMLSVVDVLGEDGLFRYWGISYGTVLGAAAVAMFPDRVDKVILDGVVNSHEYYTHESELYTDSDKTFSTFCSGCIAAPKNCSLAAGNLTASELEATIYSALEYLKYNPIPLEVAGAGFILDYSYVKGYIINQLYTPAKWPALADVLALVMTGNSTLISTALSGQLEEATGATATSIDPAPESWYGIKCGDRISRASTIEDLRSELSARHQKSRIGGDTADSRIAACSRWLLPAKESYRGNFQVRTKSPVLLIGNTYDPVTPLVSARNMSSGFEGSVVLQHNSYGHTTFLSKASLCMAKVTRAYFENGTLPEDGAKCEADEPLFSGHDGWDAVLAQFD